MKRFFAQCSFVVFFSFRPQLRAAPLKRGAEGGSEAFAVIPPSIEGGPVEAVCLVLSCLFLFCHSALN